MTPFGTEHQFVDGQTVACQRCGTRLTVQLHTNEVVVSVAGGLATTALRCTRCRFITCYACATDSADETSLLTCPSCHEVGGPYLFLKGTIDTRAGTSATPDAETTVEDPATRELRVFVSSTFRDMQEEREILVKKVFPQIRNLCEQRSVAWSEVDLRWGITDEQLVAGLLLPLCLTEIDRCRPYFIGLLGERYGYVPERIDPELEAQQSWLRECHGRSLTELEMLHGVLNDPPRTPKALFYFRDPGYAQGIAPDRRADFMCENADVAEKLAALKTRIRAAHRRGELASGPRENYASPDALGALVLEDLTALVDKMFPAARVATSVVQEQIEQQAFANSHRRALIRRPSYAQQLDEYAQSTEWSPFVVVGEAGSGKTALLAEWAASQREAHPEWTVLAHFIGGTSDSGDWVEMLRQIMSSIREQLALTGDAPFTKKTVHDEFPRWLSDAARVRRFVLVIDGLDQLVDKDGALDLTWLPRASPSELRLIVATRPGRSLAELDRRGWGSPPRRIALEPFTTEERRSALESFLGLYRKTLSPVLASEIIASPQCANPLFLRVVLDELRQFGQHDRLAERVTDYLKAVDVSSLFNRVLDRWVADFSGLHQLVQESLCLLASSRRGLLEGELLDLVGQNGPVSRLEWAAFFRAAENSLVNQGGRLTFAQIGLGTAVHSRWLHQPGVIDTYRRRLATFFRDQTALDDRRVDELAWLFLMLEDWDELREVVTDIPTFLQLRQSRNGQSLMRYWSRLEPHCDPVAAYETAVERWEAAAPRDRWARSKVLNQIGIFHHDRGDSAAAEVCIRRSLDLIELMPDIDGAEICSRLTNLGQVLQHTGRIEEAERTMRRALDVALDFEKPAGSDAATCLNNLGRLLQTTNRLTEAERCLQRAVTIWEKTNGVSDPKVAIGLANLALVFSETGRFDDAERALRRSLAIAERSFGLDDPRLAPSLNDLARVLQAKGQLERAIETVERALRIDEAANGPDHIDVERDLCTQGSLLYSASRLEEAEPVLRRALRICDHAHGPNHPESAVALNNLAAILAVTERTSEAEPLIRRALDLDERRLGPDHPTVANDLNTLSLVMKAAGRTGEAEAPSRRHLEILLKCSQQGGYLHPNLQRAVDNYMDVLSAYGVKTDEIERRIIELGGSYGVRIGPRAKPLAPSSTPPTDSRKDAGDRASRDERLRPLQVITELTAIGQSEGFRSAARDGTFDSAGRHVRARDIGVRLRAQGGPALMRSIFDAVRPRVDAAEAVNLESCWSGIDGWTPTGEG